ncbi:methyltransferase domain-containing protein [Embleya sp. NBC_00888]|uniref:methyltransferase domain-containing protein n=1 Tax=Embleya sp. NBC_00888 TaxID=2975960 RepID=UPI003863AE37|nr:methyltransferase domain-containing protein [Embleya sp. NBC_00888]
MPAPDLTDEAQPLRHKLVQTLVDSRRLTDPTWRRAFERVPRHLFMPSFYDQAGKVISSTDPDTHEQWLAAVYSDRSLVTHRTDGAATSSSSEPSLMARMLEALDLADKMTVLEIGTGTGYNAALLADRLGDGNVVSIDVTPDITTPARGRLTAAKYAPLVVTGDGALGWPNRGPYDRILATCGIHAVPQAWIEQLTDDGFILAPLGGALVRIERTGPGTATGRFLLGGAYFMPLRREAGDGVPAQRPSLPNDKRHASVLPASALTDPGYRFIAEIALPHLVWQYDLGDNGTISAARVWASDGSIADLHADGTVAQAGPRQLWDLLELAYQSYAASDRPAPDCYGLTVTPDQQYVWLDAPDSGQRWNLST